MNETIPKILLVDDEQLILDDLSPFLKRNGYQVRETTNGSNALKLVKTFRPDIIILDVIMRGINGREVLRRLRAVHNQTPVILLTMLDEPVDVAQGLNDGADDYLSKPFSKLVLLARIRNVLKRSRHSVTAVRHLISDDLRINVEAHRVWFKEKELDLTPKALTLLKYMMHHPNQLITYETLMDKLWGWQDTSGAGHQTIRSRITELRKALDDNPNQPRYIETARGEGYRFIAPVNVL